SPVLVHCLHGSDRTGAMCAAYRVVVEGWSMEDAIRERKSGGYGHHKIWSNLERWIEGLDVEALKEAAGI
ncbi:protein-tyrosine phosphatase family protein, partial [bacterium]|nr:protein-tyrosine phosphatase family protein [bacterium]